MTHNEHVADSAALYALDALDASEVASVDAHIAHCEACSHALALAYDDVAAMVEAEPQHALPAGFDTRLHTVAAPKRAAWNFRGAAIAAAFIIGLLPSVYLIQGDRAMHRGMAQDAGLMARMTSSPHRMVAFTSMSGADAKVVYGADGSWYGIIVKGASAPLHLLWMHDGQRTMLGTVEPHGDVAVLYLPASHRMDQLALTDGGSTVVAEAKLAF